MLSILVAMAAVAAPDLKLDRPDAVEGEWQAVSAKIGGMELPRELTPGIRLHFKKGTVTATLEGNLKQENEKPRQLTYKLDALKHPAEMDMIAQDGPEQGKTTRGIFKINGDEMTLCMSQAGQARPAKFESNDQNTILFVFKRVKK
jgi:uncharacterized protein (TIGR03067 family)